MEPEQSGKVPPDNMKAQNSCCCNYLHCLNLDQSHARVLWQGSALTPQKYDERHVQCHEQ